MQHRMVAERPSPLNWDRRCGQRQGSTFELFVQPAVGVRRVHHPTFQRLRRGINCNLVPTMEAVSKAPPSAMTCHSHCSSDVAPTRLLPHFLLSGLLGPVPAAWRQSPGAAPQPHRAWRRTLPGRP